MTTDIVEAPPVAPPVAPAGTPPAPPPAPPAPPAAPPPSDPPAPPGAPGAPPPATILGEAPIKPLSDVIPEKYRVKKEDGTLDVEASFRKTEEARAALETRQGTGEVRPKTADEYKLTVPKGMEKLAEAAFEPATVKAFQGKAFEQGLTQKQYEWVIAEYLSVAPTLVQGARAIDSNAAIAELKQQWPVQADFDANVGRANAAIRGYAGEDAAGIFKDYGTDPRIVRMMAKIGAEMGEDRAISNVQQVGAADVTALMKSEAYTNAKHPDHERVSAQVRDFYQRTAPKT